MVLRFKVKQCVTTEGGEQRVGVWVHEECTDTLFLVFHHPVGSTAPTQGSQGSWTNSPMLVSRVNEVPGPPGSYPGLG